MRKHKARISLGQQIEISGLENSIAWRLALRVGWSQLNLSDHEKFWQSPSAWPLDRRAADLLAYAIPPRLCFETGAV